MRYVENKCHCHDHKPGIVAFLFASSEPGNPAVTLFSFKIGDEGGQFLFLRNTSITSGWDTAVNSARKKTATRFAKLFVMNEKKIELLG